MTEVSRSAARRVTTLHAYGLLGERAPMELDSTVLLAARLCDTPLATLSVNDLSQERFISCHGLALDVLELQGSHAEQVVDNAQALQIPDTKADARFHYAPLATALPALRFYAAVPLLDDNGQALGTLAVMDVSPRHLPDEKMHALALLAAQAIARLALERRKAPNDSRAERWHTMATGDGEPAERIQELERINEHLRFAQRVANIGSWEYRVRDQRRIWSDEIYRIIGIPRETAASQTEIIASVVHPDDQAMLDEARARALGGEVTEFEHRIVRPDGEVRHVRERAQVLLRDDAGRPERLFGVIEDITERKLTQQRLREREELLQIAGQMAKLGAWQIHLGDRTVTWSDEVCAIHELPDCPPVRLSDAMQYVAPEWREHLREAIDTCIRNGTPYDEKFEIITAKGNRVWVRGIGRAVRDESGTVTLVRGALQDITQQKSAEAEMQALATRLTSTLDSISDGFMTLDNDWHVTFLNRRAEQILQRPRDALLGNMIWSDYSDARGSEFERQYLVAKQENRTVNFQEYYPPLEAWIDVTAYPSPEGLAVYFRDVTEHRLAQEALRENEKRTRAIIDNALDAIITIDAGSVITAWNPQAERIFGWQCEDAVGRRIDELIIPHRMRDAHRKGIAHFLETGEGPLLGRRVELPALHRNGREFPVELTISPIRTSTGWLFSAFARDVTARINYEKRIRRQAELLDKAQDAIIVRDMDRRITYWNRGAQRIYGWTADEAVGQAIDDLLYDDKEQFRRVIKALQSADEWNGELLHCRRDGSHVWIDCALTLVRDENDRPESVLAINTDITERRLLEEQLRQSQRLESIGELTGGVAHDFNNLLTVILGNAELLIDQLPDDSRQQKLARMSRSAAKRGAELTHRLLAFARRQALQPKITDINRLVIEMEDLVQRTLLENIDIEVMPDDDAWHAYVDAAQLESVLLNLAINAKDAMPDGGKLTVETANVELDADYAAQNPEVTPGRYVMIAVSDTGVGIAPENINRVFDPFFTTKEMGKGTGLGLSMAYGFAKQSGGHIKIYSEPGQGTTVRLYLPKATGIEEVETVAAAADAELASTGRILVVEDDDLVREHAENQLRDFGYDVLTARNGIEALEIIRKEDNIDLLFTDVIMSGGMNGRALAETAKQLRPKLKVLYTSGYTENAIVHHGRLDRGVQLLQKPYQRADLARKLRTVLKEPSPDGGERRP